MTARHINGHAAASAAHAQRLLIDAIVQDAHHHIVLDGERTLRAMRLQERTPPGALNALSAPYRRLLVPLRRATTAPAATGGHAS